MINSPISYSAICAGFRKEKFQLLSTMGKELSYTSEDLEFLWADFDDFLDRFPTLVSWVNDDRQRASERLTLLYPDTRQIWVPWTRILFAPASNAPLPIIPTMLLSLLTPGNNVIVAPGRRAMRIAEQLVDLLQRSAPEWASKIELYTGGVRQAMTDFVDTRKVSLAWIQSTSEHRSDVLSRCQARGVDLVFEGSGYAISVIDEACSPKGLATALEHFLVSSRCCSGSLCTAPTSLLLPRTHLGELEKLYVDRVESMPTAAPLEARVSGTIDPLGREPAGSIFTYERLTSAIEVLRDYPYGIQVNVQTDRQEDEVMALFAPVTLSRLLINTLPVFQRSIIPWGGYRFSGPSTVATFLEKASRSVILHTQAN